MATIFSQIIKRDLPAEIVYENEHVLAFLDIHPNNPGHTLVIPKHESTNLFDITQTSWTEVMEAVRILAPALKTAVGADGINLMMNNGEVAGQIVLHTHVHLIPRFANDGYTHWPGHPYPTDEMARIGVRIRAQLKQ